MSATARFRSVSATVLAAALLAGVSAACRGTPTVPDAAKVPEGFSVNATVIRGRQAPAVPRVEERSGRWVLLPDGSLRAAAATDPDHADRPGRARTLRESEVAELWALAVRLGLADPVAADPVGNASLLEAGPGELVQIVEFAVADPTTGPQAWTFVHRGPADAGGDRVLGIFVRALAERAWMADRPGDFEPPAAIRYDFGPDPHARYRVPEDEQP
ncbi:MAG: hypothetical protein ACO3YY_11870 [Phycisphaerales bacterium]